MNDKVKKEIFDSVSENVQALARLFPSAVKDGEVDIEALKQELGEFVEVGAEKYDFTWNGKSKAKAEANSDILGRTLKLKPGEGVNEDTTQNLYIEGDNLEALKLLRNSYYNKIKMIYIDPPYNTGNDFVYRDNFNMTEEEKQAMAEDLGEVDDEGNRLVKNNSDSSKYHTNWLNMMYPRLKIARELLTDDGVIFISIDDNEQANLKKLCDEVFGSDNFINIVSAKMKNIAGASGGGEDKRLKKNIEYILIYAKNYFDFGYFEKIYNKTEIEKLLKEYEEDNISWKYTSIIYQRGEKEYYNSTKDGDGNEIKIFKRTNAIFKSISQVCKDEKMSIGTAYYKYFDSIFTTAMPQSSIRTRVYESINQNDLSSESLYSIEYIPKTGKNKGVVYEQFYKGEKLRLFAWFRDVAIRDAEFVYKQDAQGTLWDGINLNNLTKEGDMEFANGKKPLDLLNRILKMLKSDDCFILDFFSGSATTAHAVMQLNAEDGGSRKFIMVQVPEKTAEDSEANKAGYKNICEIGKERIRRAGNKIAEENQMTAPNLDLGFKVFKVADTNIKMFSNEIDDKELPLENYIGDDQEAIDFNAGYTDIDVCYELLLRHRGIDLSSKIEKLPIGERTYMIESVIVVCLDQKIKEKMIEELAKLDPLPRKYIFRDSSFGQDISLKRNAITHLTALIEKNSGETKKTYKVEFI